MPLTPPSGSSTPPSNPSSLPSDLPTTRSDILPTMPYVSDTLLNRPAIDPSQYANTNQDLVGLMKGKRVLVQYYRLLNQDGYNNRTNVADMVTQRDVLNTEYQLIKNMEITLPGAFEFAANNAQTNVSITGKAMFYPNMNPSIGDVFLTGTGDGRIGVCRVSSVAPMTWRQNSVFIVDFMVQQFLDPETQAALDGSVTCTYVFDKANYLGGTASLLSEQTYVQLLQIKEARNNLCRAYHQMFFDPNISSYTRPDGAYDPWVTQFMSNKITLDVVPIRPKNLFGNFPKLYNQTLWSRLEDRYNTSLYLIAPYCNLMAYTMTGMGVFNSELFRRSIVMPSSDPTDGDPYLYSANFYQGTTTAMTAEEALIYQAITQRTMGDLGSLILTYLNPIPTLSLDDQFYKIPLYIHLIDMASQSQYRSNDAQSMNYASSQGL